MESYHGEILIIKTHLQDLQQIKICCQTYFIRHSLRPNTVRTLPLLNLLDILTVEKGLLFLCFETYLPMA